MGRGVRRTRTRGRGTRRVRRKRGVGSRRPHATAARYDAVVPKPRVVGGRARGRPLETPRQGTRPTPSRVREAMFDVLAFAPRGVFLDLFAGSGALGLEAASRGWRAICVDLGREAVDVVRRNARATGLDVEVRRGDALAVARALRGSGGRLQRGPAVPGGLAEDLPGPARLGVRPPRGALRVPAPVEADVRAHAGRGRGARGSPRLRDQRPHVGAGAEPSPRRRRADPAPG